MLRTMIVAICLLGIAVVCLAEDVRPEIMFRNRDNQSRTVKAENANLPIDSWKAPRQVHFERQGGRIKVYLKTSTLVFDGRTANMSSAVVLGTQMIDTPHPNLVVVTPDGMEYSQNLSTRGKLDAFDDGEYINVFGRFALTSKKKSGTSLYPEVWYKIDKNNGYTQVRYTLSTFVPVSIKKLYVDTSVGNVAYNKVRHFWQGCGVRRDNSWEPWQNLEADISQDKVVVADKLVNMMMVCNARMGFATEPVTFEGISIDKGLDGYLAYLIRSNQHVFRYTFINRNETAYALASPYSIRFTMSYMPFREYRKPRMHFMCGAQVGLSELARVGVDVTETWGYMGYPYDTQEHQEQRIAFNKDAHRYNIKHNHFCVNWYPLAGPTPRYPEPYGQTAKHDQMFTFGKYFTWGPSADQPFMCLNSRGWFENYYLNAIHNITDFDGDGLRVDCNTPNMCQNTQHGCSRDYTCETIAYYEFGKAVDKFFRAWSKVTGREYTLSSSATIQPCNNAYLDLTMTGEGESGYPDEPTREAVYTAFLYGRDFNKLTGGNSPTPLDTPKIYEMMIARCGVPMYPFSSDAPQAMIWMKYANPFRIFDVNNCEVHHPYHYDYPKYTRGIADKVFPIVYSRKNEALVVVCNESERRGDGHLVLNADTLGLPSRVMVFEPFSGTYRLAESRKGRIDVPLTFPAPWDVDFYVVKPVPKNPEVIWHDVRVWKISQSWGNRTLSVKVRGIPEKTYSHIDLFTGGMGCPADVRGARLLSYNPVDGMAKLRIEHNASSVVKFSVKFGKGRTARVKIDPLAAYEQVKRIDGMIRSLNYYEEDKQSLQGKINSIRDNADAIPSSKKREILTHLTDVERRLYVYDEIKMNGRVVKDLVDRVRRDYIPEQQWTVLGPFQNDAKSDFAFENDKLPASLDFSKTCAGLDGRTIAAKNAVGYYLDFNLLAAKPVCNAVGASMRNMTAFASSKVDSDRDRDLTIRLTGIGRAKIWLNGKLLDLKGAEAIQQPRAGGLPPEPFEATCAAHLNRGENSIVYKVESGPENWEFYTSLTDASGSHGISGVKFLPVLNSVPTEYAHSFYLNVKSLLRRQ
ncbi:MAG: hypothetical protein M1133_02540 [Armatimonadetes bacterium]|nr:hypothetical protein [Armatimonadota bacterium]